MLATVVAVGWLVGCSTSSAEPPPVVNEAQQGWEVTVYYSAVEHLHNGPIKKVVGCLQRGCDTRQEYIGYYPSDFVDAVEFLGSGLLEHGPHDGRYLNWAPKEGFWVDLVPRDSSGGILVPFVSAAASPDVLGAGSTFEVADCGRRHDGSAVPKMTCDALSAPLWTVADEIDPEPGVDEGQQVSLFVGDETAAVARGDNPYAAMIGADITMETTIPPGDSESDGGSDAEADGRSTSTTRPPFGATTTSPADGFPFGTTTTTTGPPFGVTTTTRPTRPG
jgi:hypothetical protein